MNMGLREIITDIVSKSLTKDAMQKVYDALNSHIPPKPVKIKPFTITKGEKEMKVTVTAGSNEIEITKKDGEYGLCIGDLSSDSCNNFYIQLTQDEIENLLKGIKFLQKS